VGGEVNAKTINNTIAPVHIVSNNCIEDVEALLDGGSKFNAIDGEGYTVLHYGA